MSRIRLLFHALLTLLCLLTPWPVTAAPFQLTLSASIQQVLTNNPSISIAELQAQKATIELQKSKTGYLPTVVMTHTQTQWAEKPKLDYGNYITLTLPLFDSGKTKYAILQSQADALGMEAYVGYTKQYAAQEVIFDYYEALAVKERTALLSQTIRQLTDQLTKAATPSASRSVQQAQAQLRRFNQEYRLLQQEERQIHSKLRRLLQLPPNQELVFAEMPIRPPLPAALEDIISLALAQRQDLTQLIQDQQAALLRMKITAKEAVPHIYLYSVINDLGLPEQEWYSTLYITGNLFDGGQAKLKAKQSKLDSSIAEKRLQFKIKTITQEITEAFEFWQQAGEAEIIASQAVIQAETDYLAIVEAYQQESFGYEAFFDVSMALLTARLEHLKARQYYTKCLLQLHQAAGSPLPLDKTDKD